MESIYKERIKISEVSVAPAGNVFPISSYTSLRFRLRDGVGEDGIVANVPKYDIVNSRYTNYFCISTPMKRTGELEMQLEGSGGTDLSQLEILLNRAKSRNYHHSNMSIVCTLTQEAVVISSKKITVTQKTPKIFLLNNRLGMKITRRGTLEFFLNGKSQGVVAEAVYKLGHSISYCPSMRVPPGLSLRLTAGSKFILYTSFFGMPCID
jgi:hypothetical protein